MSFEEWWKSKGWSKDDDSAAPAETAWNAAIAEAVRRVAETSKRYTCDKMRGVCKALIYELQRKDS